MQAALQFTVTILKLSAVPLTAFLIRMFRGDVHNPHEQIISDTLRAVIARLINGKEKFT